MVILVDELGTVIISILAGTAGGFLSSWMAFNASGEEFNPRKHGNALIMGTLTGLGLGAAGIVVNPDGVPLPALVVQTVTIFLGAVGIDRLRSSGSQMVANRATTESTEKAQKIEDKEEEK